MLYTSLLIWSIYISKVDSAHWNLEIECVYEYQYFIYYFICEIIHGITKLVDRLVYKPMGQSSIPDLGYYFQLLPMVDTDHKDVIGDQQSI